MNILAISGSLRRSSSNTALLRSIAESAPAPVKVTIFSDLHMIPPFNPDDEDKPQPDSVANWRTQLKSADALIFSTPEYAHGVPGVLKNALDWIVGSSEIYEKKVAVVRPSGRGEHALSSLSATLAIMGAQLLPSRVIDFPGNPAAAVREVNDLVAKLQN